MSLPEIWHYDAETGVLLSPGTADQAALIPANATDIPPPDVPDGQQAVFLDGGWVLRDIPQPEPEPEAPEAAAGAEVTVDKPGTGT